MTKDTVLFRVPINLNLANVLSFSKELDDSEIAREYVFDFERLAHAPPFGLLFIAQCIKKFRALRAELHPRSEFKAINAGHSYARTMGLWKHIGIRKYKDDPISAGSSRYTPITAFNADDIKNRNSKESKSLAETIDDIGCEQATLLTQGGGDEIENLLSYCIREVFRNVVDHSGSNDFWYCSQYWPTKDIVELAVVDEGRGFLTSLSENPKFTLKTEKEAVVSATDRGATRIHENTIHVKGMWPGYGASENQNSGLGLYVLKMLSTQAGSLTIVSNDSCVRYKLSKTSFYSAKSYGSAIRVATHPKKLWNCLQVILNQIKETNQGQELSPSMLSKLH